MLEKGTNGFRKDHIEEATSLITEMMIVPDTKMVRNNTPGVLGNKASLQTNAFGVMVERETTVFVHDVRIFADLSNTKTIEFTKKGKDDCLVNERKQKCTTIIKAMVEQNITIFPDIYKVYYDGQSLLFTTHKVTDAAYVRFTLDGKNLPLQELHDFELIVIEIKPSTSMASFTLNADLICSQTTSLDLMENNQIFTQFIGIAINQYAIMHPERHKVFEFGKSFMLWPGKEGLFPEDCKSVGDGKWLMVGSKKSVRQIEGPRGRNTNNTCIIVDAIKTAFHCEQTILEKAEATINNNMQHQLSEYDRDKIQGVIKGLFCETMHLKNNKRIQINGLSKGCASNSVFEKDGIKTTVAQYYKDKYSIQIKNPGAPLVLAKERDKINCYPMEILKVVPYQRVTISQQTPYQSQQSTRECAVPPLIRQNYIITGARALEILNPQNMYIKNAGLKVYPNPIKVNARILPSPDILYSGNRIERVIEGKWKTRLQCYLNPVTIQVWAVYCIENNKKRKYNSETLKEFARKYIIECGNRGIKLHAPTEVECISERNMEEKINTAAEHGCQLILFVVADELTATHHIMKYCERKYEVVTQQIRLSNMEKILNEGKMMTLENIINKTNIKLGGLNYGLELSKSNGVSQKWFTPDRLILGISISHPPPSAAFSSGETLTPSVVGYAANMKSSPHDFIGDFCYQDAKKTDVLICIQDILTSVVQRHQEAHNGKASKEIIIYRNGIDEGSYPLILTKEIPLIKAILKKAGYLDTKVAFIVAVKTATDVRLFRENIDPSIKPTQQNIPPGSCVDTQLVHPVFNEFYLNSHTTLQGTAKTPRYTVLYDDIKMGNDEIQGMTFALAHHHQIVAMTTGLPTPIYVASLYAERGQNLFKEYISREESSSENSSGFDDATRHLTYTITKLRNFRVNA